MVLNLQKWLRFATAPLVVATLMTCSNPAAQARMIPLQTHGFREKMHIDWRRHHEEARLNETLQSCIHEGHFPKAGRTLEEKIREANAFLERELGNVEVAGVGSSVAIVYQDKVRSHCNRLETLSSVSETHSAFGAVIKM